MKGCDGVWCGVEWCDEGCNRIESPHNIMPQMATDRQQHRHTPGLGGDDDDDDDDIGSCNEMLRDDDDYDVVPGGDDDDCEEASKINHFIISDTE